MQPESNAQKRPAPAGSPRGVAVVRPGVAIALLGLLTLPTGLVAAAVPSVSDEAQPRSIAVEAAFASATEDDAWDGRLAPTDLAPAGAHVSAEAERLEAELAMRQANLTASSYAATTVDELAEMRRDDRRALIEAAIAAGIEVDLSRFTPADAAYLATLGGLSWPLAQISITDVFGARGGRHMGLDLAAGAGTPIGSAAPGIVVLSSESYYGYGVAVIVQHLDGVQTLYGHMTNGSRQVKVGDWVEAGDVLGGVGNTGRSFGNHLHFEVRVGGVARDPLAYLNGSVKIPDLPTGSIVPVAPSPVPAGTQEPAKPSPSPTPTSTPTKTPTPAPTKTPSPTPTPTGTPTPAPTGTPTPTTPPTTPTPTPTTPPATPKPTPTEPTPTEPAPTEPEPTKPAPAPSTPAPAPSTPAPSPSTKTSTTPEPAPAGTASAPAA